MSNKIKIKAAKNAPEFVTIGNFSAEKERGFFIVEDRKFADFIISEGYGTETDASPAAPVSEETAKTPEGDK